MKLFMGSIASKDEANTLRNKILGVADDSILTDILKYKKKDFRK